MMTPISKISITARSEDTILCSLNCMILIMTKTVLTSAVDVNFQPTPAHMMIHQYDAELPTAAAGQNGVPT